MTSEQEPFWQSIAKIKAILSLRATSQIEFANALFEWRKIFEEIYGPIKHGGDRKSARAEEPTQFYADTYEKFGVRRSTVNRCLRRRFKIAPDVWFALQNSFPQVPGVTLDRLAGCDQQEQRALLPEILALSLGESS